MRNLVGYYSLRSEEKQYCETDDFFERMSANPEIEEDLERMVYWMDRIGDSIGAHQNAFRHEGVCSALPPGRKFTGDSNRLRLYCHIVSDSVVVLFNGDIKSDGARTAADCPNVGPHHTRSVGWARKLLKAGIETAGTNIDNIEDVFITY